MKLIPKTRACFDIAFAKERSRQWAWGMTNISPTERLVLLSLAESVEVGDMYFAERSYKDIAVHTGYTRRAVINACASLRDKGIIMILPTFTDYGPRANNQFGLIIGGAE